MSCACLAVIASAMPAVLWLRRLSSRTMSPGASVGASICSTQARNRWPLIAPSNTQGMLMPAVRRPATSVVNFQCPCGTAPHSRRRRASTIAPRQVRGGPGLVDEDQAVGIESRLAADEHAPGLGDIRAVLFGRV